MKWIITLITTMVIVLPCVATDIHTAVDTENLDLIRSLTESNNELLHLKNEQGLNPLNLAALSGKTAAARLLIKLGADIEEGDFENSNAMHNAAVGGHIEILNLLLENGAEIDPRDDYRMTPLHFAINFRKREAALFLIEHGADVNAKNRHDGLPLIYAVILNDRELVDVLLKKGANPETIGMNNGSTLHLAAAQGQLEIGKLLIEHGADPNVKNSEGETPLFWCGRERSLPVAQYLIEKGGNVLAKNNIGGTILHNAVQGNSVKSTQFFVDQGCPVNVMDEHGWTPLSNACFRSPEVVEYLLLNGARIDWKCSHKSTEKCTCNDALRPLLCAVSRGQMAIVKMLITHGAEVNVQDRYGRTALHFAAQKNYLDIIEFLVDKKAFTGIKSTLFGRTPLHEATINGHAESVTCLLKAGVNTDVQDNMNHTALDYAFSHNFRSIAYELLAAGADDSRITELVNLNSPEQEITTGMATVRYLGHSGWAIETDDHVLVFDYNLLNERPDSEYNCLANGCIVPGQLRTKPVTVFSTHVHGDHYHRDMFLWKHNCPGMNYVLGFRPLDIDRSLYTYIPHRTTQTLGDMTVTTIQSNDSGVGFMVEVDGVTILHPGDHAWGTKSEKTIYEKEIKFLADKNKPIDIGFFPITGCGLGDRNLVQQGAVYAARELKPAVTIPMHGGQQSQQYAKWAEFARKNGLQSPITFAVDRGDVMFYSDHKIQTNFMEF